MTVKSPFYVVPEFFSPLACEDLVDLCNFNTPDRDKDDREIATRKSCDAAEEMIYNQLALIRPEIEKHFNIVYKGMETASFELVPTGASIEPHCENSVFVRKKWLRTQARDLTAVLFLSDYQDKPPFDEEFEVYGGKLEFPQHKFGFNPQRGTLIVFPSAPHFINNTAQVVCGDAYQARFHIAATAPFIYQPTDFPGNYTSWF